MGRKLCLASLILMLFLTSDLALAGVDYGDPDGGWAYIYTGDLAASDAAAALDGTWDHYDAGSGGSDAWDGSAPGNSGSAGTGNAPGGAGIFTEGETTFLRIQDCGDPRDAGGGWADPSNRKETFVHDMGQEEGVDGSAILDNGVTISFRARIPTTPPLDDYYPDGGTATEPWVTRGYNIHDDGYGVFCVKQGAGAEGMISFSLCTPDDEGVSGTGLVMNKLNGSTVIADVDSYDAAGTEVLFTGFDPTRWHEFWIQIVGDTSGGGTHKVTIWMDGNAGAPDGIFHVTAGTKDEYDLNGYIGMSLGRTAIAGSQDIDFFAYKPGLIIPAASNPFLARPVSPLPGTTLTLQEATPLGWTPGETADKHDVYFGTDEGAVNDANATDTTGIYRGRLDVPIYLPPEPLVLGQSYYWRIDEVEADGVTIYKGAIWSFTIIDYLSIDDFESYTDNDGAGETIWQTWIDGFGVAENGAQVGYLLPPYAERTIVHSGSQSMPFFYNNVSPALYSEAVMTLSDQRDWTEQNVKALSLWFRGYPPPLGSFTEGPAGTYTMTAEGADIAGASDQFHFAWKEASGAVEIVAKVESIQDTDASAKAGVMIRDTLEADSAHATIAITPGAGVWFGYRNGSGQATTVVTQDGITAPQWVKLERTIGGLVRASYSADGASWTMIGTTSTVSISLPIYVGLAVTSHNPGVSCEAVFSNVTSSDTGQWAHQDVGLISNDAQPVYLTIANRNGASGTVYHDNPQATLINNWTEWNIDLRDFSDQGVDLTDVDSITLGVGDKNDPQSSVGSGTLFFDDIRLYPARYVPDKVIPLVADFNGDGVVDFKDLKIMTNDWLLGDSTITATEPQPAISWWSFDNNTNDSAGNITGTTRGNPTYVAGKVNQAINLDGDDYVDLGNPTSLDFGTGDWSVCAWFKTTQTGTGDENKGTIFANGGDQTGGIRYTLAVNEVTSGMMTVTTDDDVSKIQATSTTAVDDDAWHHVVGTRNGLQLNLYVDGVLEGTAALPAGYDLSGTTQHNAYVGVIIDNRDGTLIKYFIGSIDDVRIYDYALSESEILGAMGVSERYVPLTSPVNISDEEPENSKSVNFKDFAILADEWLSRLIWPTW